MHNLKNYYKRHCKRGTLISQTVISMLSALISLLLIVELKQNSEFDLVQDNTNEYCAQIRVCVSFSILLLILERRGKVTTAECAVQLMINGGDGCAEEERSHTIPLWELSARVWPDFQTCKECAISSQSSMCSVWSEGSPSRKKHLSSRAKLHLPSPLARNLAYLTFQKCQK